MAGHVFVDESKRRDFVLVAAAVPPDSAADSRNQIRSLHLPKQHGIHMVKEGAGRQRSILRLIASLADPGCDRLGVAAARVAASLL